MTEMTHEELHNLEDAMLFDRSHDLEFAVRRAAENVGLRSLRSRSPQVTLFAEPRRYASPSLVGDILPPGARETSYVEVVVDVSRARDAHAAILLAEEQIRRQLRRVPWARLPDLSESAA